MTTSSKLFLIALGIWTVVIGAFWFLVLRSQMEPGLATEFAAVAWLGGVVFGVGVYSVLWVLVAVVRWVRAGSRRHPDN